MPSVQTQLAVLLVTVTQDSTETALPCVQRASAAINPVQLIKSAFLPLEVTASAKRALSFLIRPEVAMKTEFYFSFSLDQNFLLIKLDYFRCQFIFDGLRSQKSVFTTPGSEKYLHRC